MAKQMTKAQVRAQVAATVDAREAALVHDEAQAWDEAHAVQGAVAPLAVAQAVPATVAQPQAVNAPAEAGEALPPVLVAAAQPSNAPRYNLNGPARKLADEGHNAAPTLQKLGKDTDPAWRSHGYKATNTRAIALAVILQDLGTGFTASEAQACLAKYHKAGALNLGSGTPASYVKAFVKNGYFAPVQEVAEA